MACVNMSIPGADLIWMGCREPWCGHIDCVQRLRQHISPTFKKRQSACIHVQTIAQLFSRFEIENGFFFDCDSLTRPRVAASARLAPFHIKRAKSTQFDTSALCKLINDCVENGAHYEVCLRIAQIRVLSGYQGNQIASFHLYS